MSSANTCLILSNSKCKKAIFNKSMMGFDMLYILVILFQVAKVLSPKRSQLVGILLSSLRVDVSDIEHGTVLILYMNTVMFEIKKKNDVKITEHYIYRLS